MFLTGLLVVTGTLSSLASGGKPKDVIPVAAALFGALGVTFLASAVIFDLTAALIAWIKTWIPRKVTALWVVPAAAIVGVGLGWIIWA